MVAAPQLSSSPVFSPLTFSLLLGEYKAEKQYQTVPTSPSLSPLQAKKVSLENGSAHLHFLPNTSGPIRAANRDSPVPALVPSGVASSSPLQRQMLTTGIRPNASLHKFFISLLPFENVKYLHNFNYTGRKRRGSLSSPHDHSPASPSPIATTSKRFCRHCSNVESIGERSGLVVLSRSKLSKARTSEVRAGM